IYGIVWEHTPIHPRLERRLVRMSPAGNSPPHLRSDPLLVGGSVREVPRRRRLCEEPSTPAGNPGLLRISRTARQHIQEGRRIPFLHAAYVTPQVAAAIIGI